MGSGASVPTDATPSTDERALRHRMEATLDRYNLLGQTPIVDQLATFSRDPDRPEVWDANLVRSARAATPDEIDQLLARIEEIYTGLGHRQIVGHLDMPDALEARLALDGWKLDLTLQHLLEGELVTGSGSPAAGERSIEGLTIDAVVTDDDWDAMVHVTRLDHLEEAAKEGREPWPETLTEHMVGHKRRKAPEMQPWLARLDDQPVGMFSSMPGVGGVGLVEDLFVDPVARGRGVAQALIARATFDARSRGAGPVIIGSLPDDWPKVLYARMGFRPIYLERTWQLDIPTDPGPDSSPHAT